MRCFGKTRRDSDNNRIKYNRSMHNPRCGIQTPKTLNQERIKKINLSIISIVRISSTAAPNATPHAAFACPPLADMAKRPTTCKEFMDIEKVN